MNNPNPDLVVLPFRATLVGTSDPLTFMQVVVLLNQGLKKHIQIERSYPGAPEAIGWTVFHRTSRAYCYENEPTLSGRTRRTQTHSQGLCHPLFAEHG